MSASLRLVRLFLVIAMICSVGAAAQPQGEPGDPAQCLTNAQLAINATPDTVTWNQTATLRWSATGLPVGCSNFQLTLDGQSVSRSGARSLTPSRTQTYTLQATEIRGGSVDHKTATATLTVKYPSDVLIDQSTVDPVNVLLGVLADGNDPQTIELCNVDLDMTGITGVVIGEDRTLKAAKGCERSLRRAGPRIFVRDARGSLNLFEIRGDNVVMSGFRLEGPTNYMAQGDRKEKGIEVNPFGNIATPIQSIEISNMEIYYWSGVGVEVEDTDETFQRGLLFNTNPSAVRIENNYFHHNRHGAGEGYGAEVAGGGYALIRQNAFDENRHAIAGGSKNDKGNDYSGYTARDNLILPGGGLHCNDSLGTGLFWGIVGGSLLGSVIGLAIGGWPGALIGGLIGGLLGGVAGGTTGTYCFQTHQIDMHGDQNALYSEVTGTNSYECGTAGETMLIERNTILYTKGPAIKIRGNPADKAVVDSDVFESRKDQNPIQQNGGCGFGDNITNPIRVMPNNVFGVPDPYNESGTCDFVGDGVRDRFMATGVTWWARSGATGQWFYLNTMPEKMADVTLGDVDGDGICDVTRKSNSFPRFYSKSGTGPWRPLLPMPSPPQPGPVIF